MPLVPSATRLSCITRGGSQLCSSRNRVQASQTESLEDLTHQGRRILEESKSYHADLSEDSERDLFDGRWLSSSENATLEEEGVVATGGGRLPRFLNLSPKLRFLNTGTPGRSKYGNSWKVREYVLTHRCKISSCFFFSSSSYPHQGQEYSAFCREKCTRQLTRLSL